MEQTGAALTRMMMKGRRMTKTIRTMKKKTTRAAMSVVQRLSAHNLAGDSTLPTTHSGKQIT